MGKAHDEQPWRQTHTYPLRATSNEDGVHILRVHPNDEQARRFDPTENGKTEAWVIVDARPGSRLFVGLQPGVDRETLRQCLDEGRVEECLHSFEVQAGDSVFIPAGTVHAIGEGILLAEVQQSSDLTFRLYDWGRVDADGKPRPLHIEQALACIDFELGTVNPVAPQNITDAVLGRRERSTGGDDGAHRIEELVRSAYFVMRRHTAGVPFVLPPYDRFRVLMMLVGNATLDNGEDCRKSRLGQTTLVAADSAAVEVVPDGEFVLLEIFLP